jgi:serine/threonine protein kinase
LKQRVPFNWKSKQLSENYADTLIGNDDVALLIQMQDLTHDHIARFIGICIDPKHQYIVSEYCPKGSLQVENLLGIIDFDFFVVFIVAQDILENEEIKLDTMFKHSIMHDIAKVQLLAAL